jgi:hypothetical protein
MKIRRLGRTALALGGGYLAALAATRRWHQQWGATDQETTRPLPGDDLIPEVKLDSTHAIWSCPGFVDTLVMRRVLVMAAGARSRRV